MWLMRDKHSEMRIFHTSTGDEFTKGKVGELFRVWRRRAGLSLGQSSLVTRGKRRSCGGASSSNESFCFVRKQDARALRASGARRRSKVEKGKASQLFKRSIIHYGNIYQLLSRYWTVF